MRINSKDILVGQPILKIRRLLQYTGDHYWDQDNLIYVISDVLEVSKSEAKKILDNLIKQEYVEIINISGKKQWRNTIKGNALALALAAKPISRKTAEKKLNEFLNRVKIVNSDNYYLYKVRKVILFGSYLSNQEKLGDIDIAIDIAPKEEDANRNLELIRQRADEAIKQGRTFGTFLDELTWAEKEVMLFLKSRSRSLSLHKTSDKILEQTNYEVIFEE